MKVIFTYRGRVERPDGKGGYSWCNGYSETVDGSVLYPWMTRRECQAQARKQGRRAVFENRGQRNALGQVGERPSSSTPD